MLDLYEFWKRAKGYLVPRVACVEDAEDVASAVVVRLLKARDRVDSGEVVVTDWENYAWRAVHNMLVDYRRGEGMWRRNLPLLESGDGYGLPVVPDCALAVEARDEVRRLVWRAELTGKQERVMVMRHGQEMEFDEIAGEMGMQMGAVKALRHRAWEKMRAVAA